MQMSFPTGQWGFNKGATIYRFTIYTAIRMVYDTYRDTQNQTIRITIQQVFYWLASKLNA